MINTPLLSIVIVNYNSKHLLKQCIDSIFAHKPTCHFEVLVIDNHSSDESFNYLQDSSCFSVRLVVNPKPMGYTYAANQGFGLSNGDIVLFLNPDIKVLENSIDNMIKHIEEDQSLGAIAGYYCFPDGRFHKYYNRFPAIFSCYLTFFFPTRWGSLFDCYRRYHMLDVDFCVPVEVPQPASACLMVRRKLFRDSIMNQSFCMFFSDVDICKKIYSAGKRIMVFPDCKVIHCHDYSSRSGCVISHLYALDLYIGCSNYFWIYHGFASFLAVKLLFGITLFLVVLFGCVKFLLGKSQSKKVLYKFRTLYYFLLHRNILLERLS